VAYADSLFCIRRQMICSNLLIFKGYSSDDFESSDEYPLKISDSNGTNLLESTTLAWRDCLV
jgi:hypothetical protein